MTSGRSVYYATPELYDLMYDEWQADVPFLVAEAKAAAGAVLEVCCGTGRVLIPSLEAGVRIEGLDYDLDMLEACRAKARTRGLDPVLHQGDMRDFTLPGRYAMITIPFNSFLHNLTAQDQIATLRCCRAHLESNGRLMLSLFVPDTRKLLANDGTLQPAKGPALTSGDRSLVITESITSDRVEQKNRVHRVIERLDADGRVVETRIVDFELRYVHKNEMALLFQVAGFGRCEVRPGYADKPTLEEGDTMLWTAWKE